MDLAALLPKTKFDTALASELVAIGYPEVEPVLRDILAWQQDMNWPVARVFQPLLVSIGQPLSPFVSSILAGDDEGWKYSLLVSVVAQSPELARALRSDLERLATQPSSCEVGEELDQLARQVLAAIAGKTEA